MDREPGCPPAQGLYDPSFEKDACGVGFVVNVKGVRSHAIVRQALQLLVNLLHRGACGCEVNTGDGAGILIQMPDAFLRRETRNLGIELPPAGEYGAGCVFLPRDPSSRATIEALVEEIIQEEGQTLLGWRDLPPTIAWSAHRRRQLSRISSNCSSEWARRGLPPVLSRGSDPK
jgi:glutamate synthase domain-containing protein 1